MKEKLLSLCTSVLTALAVLTGSIAVPLLVRPFYWLHIKPFGLERTGLTAAQIREAYDGVMDYCLGLRDTFSAGVLPFSAEGASHFADVRVLFLLDLWVLLVSLAALVLLWVYRRHKAVELHRFRGRGSAFWGCVGLGAAFLVIGAAAAVDFDRAFTIFHTLFFPGKDNWLFDPYTDPVILLLPQEFFRNCAILILALLLIACAILMLRDRRKR
ncbi:MAG: TIGR01906 family membrane protein [Oscillospiraceae bacterium]|nr:TIGR01906 family membrane protein [Oscillospiraceae bacterium]